MVRKGVWAAVVFCLILSTGCSNPRQGDMDSAQESKELALSHGKGKTGPAGVAGLGEKPEDRDEMQEDDDGDDPDGDRE